MFLLYGLAVPCFCFWFLLQQQRRGPCRKYLADDTSAENIPGADLEAIGNDNHAQSFRTISNISTSGEKSPSTDEDSSVIDPYAQRLAAATAAVDDAAARGEQARAAAEH